MTTVNINIITDIELKGDYPSLGAGITVFLMKKHSLFPFSLPAETVLGEGFLSGLTTILHQIFQYS